MKISLIILILAAFSASPVLAASATYTTSSSHPFGPSHNKYGAAGSSYGASKDNYNGHQAYGSSSHTTGGPATYLASKQALATSAPY